MINKLLVYLVNFQVVVKIRIQQVPISKIILQVNK